MRFKNHFWKIIGWGEIKMYLVTHYQSNNGTTKKDIRDTLYNQARHILPQCEKLLKNVTKPKTKNYLQSILYNTYPTQENIMHCYHYLLCKDPSPPQIT